MGIVRVLGGLGHILHAQLRHRVPLSRTHGDDHDDRDDLDGRIRRIHEGRGQTRPEHRRVLNLISQFSGERTYRIASLVGMISNSLKICQNSEEREEDRHLDENRHARGQGIRPMLAVQRHHLLLLALLGSGILLPLVLRLERLELGLHELHATAGPDLLDEQRHDENTHEDRQADNRQNPGGARPIAHADEHEELVDVYHDPGYGNLEGPQDRVHCTPCFKAWRASIARLPPTGTSGLLPPSISRWTDRP